jgi:acyl-CoA reductase-like NAD-dependent aldehyde dehydrogenase
MAWCKYFGVSRLDLFSREDKLVEHAKAIKVSAGTEPDADLGPVISEQVDTCFKSLTNLSALKS